MEIIFEKWNEILEHVRKEHELSDISFKTWLQPLKIHQIDDHVVKIIVPIDKAIDYISSKFQMPIFVAIAEFTGEEYDITFITEKEAQRLEQEEVPAKPISRQSSVSNVILEKSNIIPKYTFDSFVVGSNNKFAHAAALAVSESPGKI